MTMDAFMLIQRYECRLSQPQFVSKLEALLNAVDVRQS